MLKTMAANPIVFAMANPDPEIPYPLAVATRKDVIMATGRSDYPNQVNNVLGFPFIFRGALDVRATAINNEMKMAAARALAQLAKEDVPEVGAEGVRREAACRSAASTSSRSRSTRACCTWEAPAVAKAACDTGVARKPITDWGAYRERSSACSGPSRKVMHFVMRKARNDAPRASCSPRASTTPSSAPRATSSTSRSRCRSCSAASRRSAETAAALGHRAARVRDRQRRRTRSTARRYAEALYDAAAAQGRDAAGRARHGAATRPSTG